jgi:hypothetical protein
MDDLDRDGCDVQILDSVTHEWNGKNGVLAQADKFGEWKTVRPKHNSFVERILSSQAHVIVCIRAKMKYAVSEEEDTRPNRSGTRQVIEKVGLGPVQDEQLLYEFDVVADVDVKTHEATFSNRCDPLVGQTHLAHPRHRGRGHPERLALARRATRGGVPKDVERLRELALSTRPAPSDEEIDAALHDRAGADRRRTSPRTTSRAATSPRWRRPRQQRQREPEPAPANASRRHT